ncbi:hypothetical protein HD554DRAFT_1600951 [Boletus coccyginus]|nr:hypothetical protein HD554DRAFT_1600951 [Boletus coccyginus]
MHSKPLWATMLQSKTPPESPLQTLPLPVTANGDVARSNGQIGVGRGAAPSLIAFTTGLIAISSKQPRAALLFIGAGTVIIGLYFVPPMDDEKKTRPIMSTFLRRLPDVFAAFGCILIVLGIGNTFPNQIALIPLFSFVSFTALAALLGMTLGVLTTAILYGTALVSLITFVVLVCVA